MSTVEVPYTADEVVERGKALYEQSIRAEVEEGNIGKLLLIDIMTGNYVLGEDRIEMARRLRERNAGALNFGMRIGYPSAEKIGAWPLSRAAWGEQSQ
jgi:hypothetical protein